MAKSNISNYGFLGRTLASLAALCFGFAGCTPSASVATVGTETSTAALDAVPTPPLDPDPVDPKQCIDPLTPKQEADKAHLAELDAELDERVDALLPKLAACTREMGVAKARLSLRFVFYPGGKGTKAWVAKSTLTDCDVVDCVAKVFGDIEALTKATNKEGVDMAQDIAVERGSAARRLEPRSAARFGEAKATCAQAPPDELEQRVRRPPEAIQSLIRSHYPKMRSCYERGLAKKPRLMGRMDTRFIINADGSVRDVGVADNTIPDCEVVHCVRDVFKTLQLPPAPGIVTVVYPLQFAPG